MTANVGEMIDKEQGMKIVKMESCHIIIICRPMYSVLRTPYDHRCNRGTRKMHIPTGNYAAGHRLAKISETNPVTEQRIWVVRSIVFLKF